jgi:hypothetical protein
MFRMQEAATTMLYVVFSMPLAYMCSFTGASYNEVKILAA